MTLEKNLWWALFSILCQTHSYDEFVGCDDLMSFSSIIVPLCTDSMKSLVELNSWAMHVAFLFTGEFISNRLAMWIYAAYALTSYAQLRSDHAVIKCVHIVLLPYAATRSPILQLLVLQSQFAPFAEPPLPNWLWPISRPIMMWSWKWVHQSRGDQESLTSVKVAVASRGCLLWAHLEGWVVVAQER